MARIIGYESSKMFNLRQQHGFWDAFASGPVVLDIGYRGGTAGAQPVLPHATGVELGDAGYNGLQLPWGTETVDTVHSSHVLEHVPDAVVTLREWFRVLKVGGFLITFVPHAFLYERRLSVPPSRWSPEHLRCYTNATLLADVEKALSPNTYRVRHNADCDVGYDYALPLEQHPQGALEIELVLQKIQPPAWHVES